MQIPNRVKKWVDKEVVRNILNWKFIVYDDVWEQVPIVTKIERYKYKLSNDKQFMKRWIDRKVSRVITESLRDVDLWFLYKIQPYMDWDSVIDFKRFKIDYKYSDSKLSKSKKPLIEAWIIKEYEWLIYMNPIVWIIWKEIKQELIEIFRDVFEKYNIDITF